MSDWVHNLPIVWMALLVFGLTALVTAAIYVVVTELSVGEKARSFQSCLSRYAISAGRPFRSFYHVHRLASLERQR